MEKIDVLLASYNGEKYIREQIDSILNQTYKNIHLIISDDFSTDGTIKILKEYEKKDDRITVYYQNENLGYVKNFEFLLSKVSSEYYMFSDQDDVWYKDKIEASYTELKQKDVDLVFCNLEIVDENLNSKNINMFDHLKARKYLKKYKDYRLIYMDNIISGCTILTKKSFLKLILPLPSSKYLIFDYWISLVTILNGKFSYLEKPYIKYRQHGDNQIGIKKTSTKFKKFDMVRSLFIEVKIQRFTEFVKRSEVFSEDLRILNVQALNYYTDLQKKQYINFKNLSTFHKLYKIKGIKLYIANFVILNLPLIGKLMFNIRYLVLKVLKRI